MSATPTRPGTGAMRALRVELRLHRETVAGTVVFSVIALLAAGLLTDILIWVAPLWAALLWYRLGREDEEQSADLRAGLGLSRADALRGRAALAVLLTLGLTVVTAIGTGIADAVGMDGATSLVALGSTIEGPVAPALLSLPIQALTIGLQLTITGLVVGKECTTRRPGTAMWLLSLISYGGAVLLTSLLAAAGGVLALQLTNLVDLPVEQQIQLFGLAQIVLLATLLAVALHLLRRRVRAWAGALDAGAEIARG
ncbi:hypothetical protein [Brachybacterium hainanense]|uniref:Integral membrane protein n=1 Tax=Brachybacterium hainanense TaxID=1541174 RepID=A0ABV6RJ61_9MICO